MCHPVQKIILRWIKDLNVRPEITRRKQRKHLPVLAQTPSWIRVQKHRKWEQDAHGITSRKMISIVKRPLQNREHTLETWEKPLSQLFIWGGFTSRRSRTQKLNKFRNSNFKMNTLEYFSKKCKFEEIYENCSILSINEIQIKTVDTPSHHN